jgi:hypothetical protein
MKTIDTLAGLEATNIKLTAEIELLRKAFQITSDLRDELWREMPEAHKELIELKWGTSYTTIASITDARPATPTQQLTGATS